MVYLDGKVYQQQIGTAMGSKPAPSFVNIQMAQIDPMFNEIPQTMQSMVKVQYNF